MKLFQRTTSIIIFVLFAFLVQIHASNVRLDKYLRKDGGNTDEDFKHANCDNDECIPFNSEIYTSFDEYAFTIGVSPKDDYSVRLSQEGNGTSSFLFKKNGLIQLTKFNIDDDNDEEISDYCLQAGHDGAAKIIDGTIVRVKKCNPNVLAQRFVLYPPSEAYRGGIANIVVESNDDLLVVYSGSYPPKVGDRIIIKHVKNLGPKRLDGWGFD